MLADSLEIKRLLRVINELNWRVPFDSARRYSGIFFSLIMCVSVLDESEMYSGDIFGMLMIECKLYVLKPDVFLVLFHLFACLN